jgi:hypothetical protein
VEPTPTPAPAPFLADGFESGFGAWSSVTRDGDATVSIDPSPVFAGAGAVHLHVTSSSTSRANLDRVLPAGTASVLLDGRFNILGEGLSGSNVPTFRLFNGTTRILEVYRENVAGDLWLRTNNGAGGWTYYKLGRVLTKGQWYRVSVNATAAGGSSTVAIELDGVRLFDRVIPLVSTSFTDAMVGAEHVRQVMELYADEVTIRVR